MKKIVVGMSGASGTIYGLRLLENLHAQKDIEVHLVMSRWAKENLSIEATGYSQDQINSLADFVYSDNDMGAKIASGSFQHSGMVIVPASMKTIAAIAAGIDDNLITRSADVTLKERRPLIIVPRETPLNTIHLRNLLTLSEMNVDVIPPIPAFYNQPKTIDDLINHTIMKLLDHLHINNDLTTRWKGLSEAKKNSKLISPISKNHKFQVSEHGFTMTVLASRESLDLLVQLVGGDVPHFGVVSTIDKTKKIETHALPSRPGHVHQEGILTEHLANIIKPVIQGNAIITGGVHVNNITPEQMNAATSMTEILGEQLVKWLKENPVTPPELHFAKSLH